MPSSTESSLASISAVNLTSTISLKLSSISFVTTKPSSVGTSCFFSLKTYPLSIIVEIVGEYVLGLPMPSSSSVLTSEASVYLAGGSVKFCFGSIFSKLGLSPTLSFGRFVFFFSPSSSSAATA